MGKDKTTGSAGAGLELKYVYTTEYGRKSGRVHHHLVINGGIDRSIGYGYGFGGKE